MLWILILTLGLLGAVVVVVGLGAWYWTRRTRHPRPLAPVRLCSTVPVALHQWPLPPLDSTAVQVHDRILLTRQENVYENGIWIVTDTGEWSRSPDLCRESQVVVGDMIWIQEGTRYRHTQMVLQVRAVPPRGPLRYALAFEPLLDLCPPVVYDPHQGLVSGHPVGVASPHVSPPPLMWTVGPHELQASTVTWAPEWLPRDQESIWICYVYAMMETSQRMVGVTRYEFLVSAADDVCKVSLLYEPEPPSSKGEDLFHIKVRHQEWWQPMAPGEPRTIVLLLENSGSEPVQCHIRLHRQ